MSNIDYSSGLSAGYGHARAVTRNAEAKISEWSSHVDSLNSKLARAEEVLLFREVARDATDIVLSMALEALAAANPNSPLLDKNTRETIRRQHIASSLKKVGYQFDITTGDLTSKFGPK